MMDELAKMLAAEITRLTDVRIKADDYGTRPLARDVMDMVREYLMDEGHHAAAEALFQERYKP